MLFAQAQHNTIRHKATRWLHDEKREKTNRKEKKMTHNDGELKAEWFQVDSILTWEKTCTLFV